MGRTGSRSIARRTAQAFETALLCRQDWPTRTRSPHELAFLVPALKERDDVPTRVERLNRMDAGVGRRAIFVAN